MQLAPFVNHFEDHFFGTTADSSQQGRYEAYHGHATNVTIGSAGDTVNFHWAIHCTQVPVCLGRHGVARGREPLQFHDWRDVSMKTLGDLGIVLF